MALNAQIYRKMVNRTNGIIIGLQRVGIVFGPMQLLTVRGRRTGQPRTFPIAVVPLDGQHYVIQAYPKAAWVANVRAADTVTLTRGRRSSTARLVELPVDERRPVLRDLISASGRSAGKRLVTTGQAESPTPEGVAASADKIAVFRVEPA
ncbi:MAG TPA: nitroreductase family deazaflavin-dependent oxidoreductase [Pseudonocardiaceae bacterium]